MQTVTIILGGRTFTVPVFTIGMIEEAMEAATKLPPHKMPLAILKIALARADTPLAAAEVDGMVATFAEVKAALDVVLAASGFDLKSPNGEAPAGV